MKQYCKECKILKELSEYYKHPKWVNWVLWRCKDCIKKWRKSEEERKKARIYDNKRAKTPERLSQFKIQSKKYRKENPLKYKSHQIVNNYYRNHKEERPTKCTICLKNWYIQMHHEDYNKPKEIIPLCVLCHKWYHKWDIKINTSKTINIWQL